MFLVSFEDVRGIGSKIHQAIAAAGGDQFDIFMVDPSRTGIVEDSSNPDPPYLESRLHVEDPEALKAALEAIDGVLQVEWFDPHSSVSGPRSGDGRS